VVVGQRVPERLLPGSLAAQAGLQEAPGCLAGPETGDLHLTRELPEGSVDSLVELCFGNRDLEANLVAVDSLDGGVLVVHTGDLCHYSLRLRGLAVGSGPS